MEAIVSTDRVIVEHKDGRTYSVTPADAEKHYPDFKVVGPETPEAFVAKGVPKPKRDRKRPAPKDARPIARPIATAAPVDEGE